MKCNNNEELKIYTVEEYFEKLKDLRKKWLINHSKFTIFVGAGFSRNFGMPGWEEYAYRKLRLVLNKNKIKLNYSTEQEIKNMDKKHILTLLESYCSENDLKIFEKEIFDINTNDDVYKINKEKYSEFIENFSLINASFVTTNYDNVLEKYFGFNKKEVLINVGEEYILDVGDVFHIHGDIEAVNSNDKIIATYNDYFDRYYSDVTSDFDRLITEYLDKIIEKNEILFVGYSLSEPEILSFILRNKKTNNNITVLVPKRNSTNEEVFFQLYKQLGLNVIFLSIDDNGYGVIIEFLDELSRIFKKDNIIDFTKEEGIPW